MLYQDCCGRVEALEKDLEEMETLYIKVSNEKETLESLIGKLVDENRLLKTIISQLELGDIQE